MAGYSGYFRIKTPFFYYYCQADFHPYSQHYRFSYAWHYFVQGRRDFGQATENLCLNSAPLSDCFSGDGWELAQLGTDIHSPIQSIERWFPLGHKSQLLPGLGAKALQRAISEASNRVRSRGERRRGAGWQFAQMKLCTDNSEMPPKLFDMPNRLPFTIHGCREEQRSIHCYYDSSLWGWSRWYYL